MEELNNMQENEGLNTADNQNEGENSTTTEEVKDVEENPADNTFTQEKVNEIVRDRLNKVYKRYGVNDKNGLDDLVAKAQSYSVMSEMYEATEAKNKELLRDLAFLRNNINPDRQNDIMAHFKGNGVDFTEENLINELSTHPEWLNPVKVDDKPKTTFEIIGNDSSTGKVRENEADMVAKMFGFDKFVK